MDNVSQLGASQARRGPGEPASGAPRDRRRRSRHAWRRVRAWVRANTFAPSWLPARLRHPAFGFLVAVILEGIAVALTLLLLAVVPGFGVHVLLGLLGVILVALAWGAVPGLVATLVGTALLEYAAFLPQFSWSLAHVDEAVSVGLTLVVGVLISLIAGQVARGRHQVRGQAEAQEAQLQTIFETLADGLLVTDQQGYPIQRNKAARALLGLDQAPDYPSWSVAERVRQFAAHDAQGQPLTAAQMPLSRVLRGEVLSGQTAQELGMRTLDGREVVLSVSGAPIRTRAGQITSAVLVARDVTGRRRLEERTQHALDALLHLAHALIGAPLEAATLPVVLARQLAAFTIEALGEERVLLTGRDPETDKLHSLVASGITLEQEAEWRSTMEGTRLREWWGQKVVARLESGEVVHLAAADVPLRTPPTAVSRTQRLLAPLLSEHRLIGVLVLGRPERKPPFTQHEEALLLAVAQFCALVLERERVLLEREEARAHALALEEANRQMEAFVSMVSHELRTPLTSMKLSLQLIQNRLERSRFDTPAGEQSLMALPTSLGDLLAPAERQAMRLERLINDLLVASRLGENALDLQLGRADLRALVQEVVAEQRALTPERVIDLLPQPDQPLLVQVDGDRVQQAVVNYLTNALKYSPETAPVEVGVEQVAGQARVWVHDYGPGILLGGTAAPVGTLSSGTRYPGAKWPGGRAGVGTVYHQKAHRAATGAGGRRERAGPGVHLLVYFAARQSGVGMGTPTRSKEGRVSTHLCCLGGASACCDPTSPG